MGCYYLLDQTDDFWTAQDNCLTEDAHLAYINSLEKQLAIEEYLSSITFESKYSNFVLLALSVCQL